MSGIHVSNVLDFDQISFSFPHDFLFIVIYVHHFAPHFHKRTLAHTSTHKHTPQALVLVDHNLDQDLDHTCVPSILQYAGVCA